MSARERTLVLVKPDGLQRGKVGAVLHLFERKGLQLVALKLLQASEQHFREHYADIAAKPYYSSQVRFMSSGPVVAAAWEGRGAVRAGRALLGHVRRGPPGALRFNHSLNAMMNVVHASDNVASAQREIALWFTVDELVPWTQEQQKLSAIANASL